MPEICGSFRLAKVFDGQRDGKYFFADRPPLSAGEELDRTLTYLRGGAILFVARSQSDDLIEPDRRRRVPIAVHTDGTWIWDASIAYYLTEHDLPPEPEFMAYLRARDFRYEAPSTERIQSALAATRSHRSPFRSATARPPPLEG